jgi:hypothetical protein
MKTHTLLLAACLIAGAVMAAPGPASAEPIYISFLWHMHQPLLARRGSPGYGVSRSLLLRPGPGPYRPERSLYLVARRRHRSGSGRRAGSLRRSDQLLGLADGESRHPRARGAGLRRLARSMARGGRVVHRRGQPCAGSGWIRLLPPSLGPDPSRRSGSSNPVPTATATRMVTRTAMVMATRMAMKREGAPAERQAD